MVAFSKAPSATKEAAAIFSCSTSARICFFTSSPTSNTANQTRVSPGRLTSLPCMPFLLVDPQSALAMPVLDGLFGIEPEFLVAAAKVRPHPRRLELQHQMHFRWRHRQLRVDDGSEGMDQLRPFRIIEP